MRNMSSKKIWMEVTRDEYELPVKIADSVEELAEMCGTSTNTIRSTISHWKKGRLKTCVYRKVEIEEEESERTEGTL
jgi:CYTH domain-containing protein